MVSEEDVLKVSFVSSCEFHPQLLRVGVRQLGCPAIEPPARRRVGLVLLGLALWLGSRTPKESYHDRDSHSLPSVS